jgi:hypothetical protein
MLKQQMDRTFGGPTVSGRARKSAQSGWFGGARETNLCCSMCSRVFPNGRHRNVDGAECCPYADCEGLVRDAADWSSIRREHPNYPALPWLGIQYPLHPPVQKTTA